MEKVLNAPAFVVHLKRATERLDFFTENIKNAGFTNMQIYDAIDGQDIKLVTDVCNELNCKFDIEPSAGQIGATLSQIKIWKKIIDEKIEIATIFEDDVYFHPKWSDLCNEYWKNTPSDFDIVLIGNGIQTLYGKNPMPKVCSIPAWCLHAYIISYEGAKRLLNAILNWDYKSFYHHIRGRTLTGLYPLDIMLVDIKQNIICGKIPKLINWYVWNGTHYPCADNSQEYLKPDPRNTGLVFQFKDGFGKSYCSETYTGVPVEETYRGKEVSIVKENQAPQPPAPQQLPRKTNFLWSKKFK